MLRLNIDNLPIIYYQIYFDPNKKKRTLSSKGTYRAIVILQSCATKCCKYGKYLLNLYIFHICIMREKCYHI